ncbi:MAG: hypothetical protein R3320_09205, partial [Nitriliruptorales bacterium]|nr:hypothetical protein [Nitriliruptorales bacterium]
MPLDLDDALRELADGPIPPLDTDEIVQAGRRRRRLTHAAVAMLVIALVVGVVAVVEQLRPTSAPIVGTVEDVPTSIIGSTASRQTGAGYAAVRLTVLPNRLPAGQLPDTILVNDGAVPLYATPQCAVDRWNGDGWEDLGQDRFSPPSEIPAGQPGPWGSCLSQTEHADLGPGRYRIRWQVTAGGPRLDNPRLVVAGQFELVDTPRVDTFEDLPTSAEPVDPDALEGATGLAEAMGLVEGERPFALPVAGSDREVYVSARET